MALPPRTAEGHVQPHNDPDIKDDDYVLRRINPYHHTKFDENMGTRRISSAAFGESTAPPYGMSVDVETWMLNDSIDPLSKLPTPEWGLVRVLVGNLRKLGLQVGSDPLLDNPYHAEVWGVKNNRPRQILKIIECIKQPSDCL